MNDDLFNYLVATDELDSFLGYEPKCPNCGSKLLEIVYGMPDSEMGEKAMKGELFLGGFMIDDDSPKYHCNTCKRSYFENLKDYIEEENNFELGDDE